MCRISKHRLLFNLSIILGEHLVYRRCVNIKPTLTLFKAKLRATYQTEKKINDTEVHKKK